MVWSRIILDGIVLCIIFNLAVALLWAYIPGAFSTMLTKEIRKAAPPRRKKEVIILASVLYPMYILIFAYMIVSSHLAGITGFWNLFWTGYIEMMFINMGDFLGLDWLYREKLLDRVMIPGTEHCKTWQTKEWMKALGMPEHLVAWPVVICPAVGFIVAGISSWIY